MPDFGTSIGRTFQASVEALLAFGKYVVLVVVALAPWLAGLAVLLLAVVLAARWSRRRRSTPPPLDQRIM